VTGTIEKGRQRMAKAHYDLAGVLTAIDDLEQAYLQATSICKKHDYSEECDIQLKCCLDNTTRAKDYIEKLGLVDTNCYADNLMMRATVWNTNLYCNIVFGLECCDYNLEDSFSTKNFSCEPDVDNYFYAANVFSWYKNGNGEYGMSCCAMFRDGSNLFLDTYQNLLVTLNSAFASVTPEMFNVLW
jgi:hypothetical protein